MTTQEKARAIMTAVDAVCQELATRKVRHIQSDVFSFVSACWPTDSTAPEIADDFIAGSVTPTAESEQDSSELADEYADSRYESEGESAYGRDE